MELRRRWLLISCVVVPVFVAGCQDRPHDDAPPPPVPPPEETKAPPPNNCVFGFICLKPPNASNKPLPGGDN